MAALTLFYRKAVLLLCILSALLGIYFVATAIISSPKPVSPSPQAQQPGMQSSKAEEKNTSRCFDPYKKELDTKELPNTNMRLPNRDTTIPTKGEIANCHNATADQENKDILDLGLAIWNKKTNKLLFVGRNRRIPKAPNRPVFSLEDMPRLLFNLVCFGGGVAAVGCFLKYI